jgi:predicted enzyme related to lactoylglutathione lyase
MALQLGQVNLKARDEAALGGFWAAALGWGFSSEEPGAASALPAGADWPSAATSSLDFIAVPDPETVRYHTHLELATTSAAHQAELVERLRDLGATPVEAAVSWPVLADPEGNQFCVREPREGYRDTGPIAAIVVDCTDPGAMTRFWTDVLGWTRHDVTDEHALLRAAEDIGPYLELARTPHLPSRWHRAHLDLVPRPVSGFAAEVARVEALGATPADVGQGEVTWRVLADPEGNEFCILGPAAPSPA